MDKERQERIGQNEAAFRVVNEGIRAGHPEQATLTVLCECGTLGCNERIDIGLAEYERVRQNPLHFIVVPGHDFPGAETVVDHGERFDVVEKRERGADIAAATDPRG